MTRLATPQPAEAERRSTAAAGGRVVLVTGMSGAGHSTALKAFEDMGYEAVDNLPLSLLGGLVRPETGFARPLAIGVDIRTRDFGLAALLREIERLTADSRLEVDLVFLECDDEILRRRYTETRRRHPLARDRAVADGIAHERLMLTQLRSRADVVIDTSTITAQDLRRVLEGHFGLERQRGLALFVTSFSYRHGLPRDADLVFDARFLANPHYDPALRPLDGRADPVAEHVVRDANFAPFFDGLTQLLSMLLPAFEREGKSYVTIAIGCTGGRHRSVVVAERLVAWLATQGRPTTLNHRDLQRSDG